MGTRPTSSPHVARPLRFLPILSPPARGDIVRRWPMAVSIERESPTLSAPTERFVSSADLRETFGVSDSTLKAWRARGMPFIGGGVTRPRYRLSEVIGWLEAGKA